MKSWLERVIVAVFVILFMTGLTSDNTRREAVIGLVLSASLVGLSIWNFILEKRG